MHFMRKKSTIIALDLTMQSGRFLEVLHGIPLEDEGHGESLGIFCDNVSFGIEGRTG